MDVMLTMTCRFRPVDIVDVRPRLVRLLPIIAAIRTEVANSCACPHLDFDLCRFAHGRRFAPILRLATALYIGMKPFFAFLLKHCLPCL